jgi:hypothetical protein
MLGVVEQTSSFQASTDLEGCKPNQANGYIDRPQHVLVPYWVSNLELPKQLFIPSGLVGWKCGCQLAERALARRVLHTLRVPDQ